MTQLLPPHPLDFDFLSSHERTEDIIKSYVRMLPLAIGLAG